MSEISFWPYKGPSLKWPDTGLRSLANTSPEPNKAHQAIPCLSQKWVKLDKIMYCNVPQTARRNLRRQKHNVPDTQHDLSVCLKLADRMVARQAKQFEKSGFFANHRNRSAHRFPNYTPLL